MALPFPPTLAAFELIDWCVLGGYLVTMLAIGVSAAWRESRHKSDTREFFLGGRSMPTWALAISIVGSSLSAATFIGAPDYSYGGNLSYLILNLGGLIAVFVVGFVFVPRLYNAGTVTIYGYLAQRFGEPARMGVSVAFLMGRMLASGARLMMVAVPLCMMVYGVENPEAISKRNMVLAILAVGFVGTFYTVFGGIKTVIWVDVIQFVLVVGAAALTIGLLLHKIPLGAGEIVRVLNDPANTADGSSKLKLVDLSTDPRKPFTLWAALSGALLLNIAAFGVDHDLAQRFLVAKSPGRGALSVIASQFVSVAVVSMFLLIGLLLFIFYKRPDVMGAAAPGYAPAPNMASYQQFMLRELPPVVSGLAITGLFAVAQGSMDSAINAMASSAVADLYLPVRKLVGRPIDPNAPVNAPKWAVAVMGAAMTLFAIGCAFAYDPNERGFLDFALGVMAFAFSGMLAVFFTGLLTRRGNSVSVILALVTGVVAVALMRDTPFQWITGRLLDEPRRIAFTWAMPVATGLAFLVCVAGRPAAHDDRRGFEGLQS
jgi:SSS family transporter